MLLGEERTKPGEMLQSSVSELEDYPRRMKGEPDLYLEGLLAVWARVPP